MVRPMTTFRDTSEVHEFATMLLTWPHSPAIDFTVTSWDGPPPGHAPEVSAFLHYHLRDGHSHIIDRVQRHVTFGGPIARCQAFAWLDRAMIEMIAELN